MGARGKREVWTEARIIARLRARRRAGRSLAYRAVAKADRPLLAAARYHFGGYRDAIAAAGLASVAIPGRPRWTKDRIIRQIKQARRTRRDLCWAAVTRRADTLRRAAYAAVRLFGNWPRALQAAGVDVDEFRRYRLWDAPSVAHDLRQRHADGEPMNSAAVQTDDAGLYAAAIRYFGTYDRALRAARLKPAKVRMRKRKVTRSP